MTGRRKRAISIAVTAAILVILAAVFLVRTRTSQLDTATPYQREAVQVSTDMAAKGTLHITRRYLAFLEPETTAAVAPEVAARIEAIPVEVGQGVAAGETLAILDSDEATYRRDSLSKKIDEVTAELRGVEVRITSLERKAAYWEREAARTNRLVEEGVLARVKAESAAVRQAEAAAALGEAERHAQALRERRAALHAEEGALETRLSYYTLRSPFDGLIAQRNGDPGDMASPGAPLFTVEQRTGWKLIFKVPQEDLPRIRPGLQVAGRLSGRTITAAVTTVSPSVGSAGMAAIEAALEHPNAAGDTAFGRGVSLTATVTLEELEGVVTVPLGALVTTHEPPSLYVVSGDRAFRRTVTVLGRSENRAAAEGIDAGTEVVTHAPYGWTLLSDGGKVVVR